MAARRVAAARDTKLFSSFYVYLVVVFIITHSYSTLALQYSRTELLQLNRGAQYLPIGHYTIPPEIIKPPTGTPAAASRRRKRCERGQKRGKRAGVGARLKAKPFRLPLPTIFLSNARSIRNKIDEIRLQLSTLKDLNNCCCMIFSETWLDSSTPDAAIELADRSVYRADRTADSGKKTGGGLSIYIANSWCTNNTVVDKLCSPDAELLLLKCRPFYLPREYSAVYICAVYIAPDANAKYTPKIKSAETTVRTLRTWPESAVPMLQDCFHHTDWDVFREQGTVTRDILDNYTTSVLDYICFCLDNVTTWKQSRVYPNTPPWMTHGVQQLLRARNSAFRSGDHEAYSRARTALRRGIKSAKQHHRRRIEARFADTANPRQVWEGIRAITDYKKKTPSIPANSPTLAEDLNRVRVGNNFSSTLSINTGAPQGYVLSPLLYTLFTHDCSASSPSNLIVKFADDTT
ncbi:unnamed protein product, partial [Menidia menidia]